VVVVAHLEKRQPENLVELAEFRRRTEQKLAEITDKLDGLIGCIDNQRSLRSGFRSLRPLS
jgi:hypothetical protein